MRHFFRELFAPMFWRGRCILIRATWKHHFWVDDKVKWSFGFEVAMVLKTIYCILVDRFRGFQDAYTRSKILVGGPQLIVVAIYKCGRTGFPYWGDGADWMELYVPDTFWKNWWYTIRTNGP